MRASQIIKTWRTTLGQLMIELFGGLIIPSGGLTITAGGLTVTAGGTSVAAGAYRGKLSTLTYGPSIAVDASLGNEFVVTITDGVAFVTANPTNAPAAGLDQIIIITYKNGSGGAHGAGTFDTLYKVSANLAAIADTKNRSIAFRWDGTNWVELWRTAADVAN